ncbi:uncharacterized protein DUF2809 [Microterricola gilva]|uniref:Uncharacterized protein DUF2809 n=1 Tax=Microterricola gilva TaxID=393267 RepID=A0A4Q8AJS9_9MICO|nr:DUF2809 domain-containing protein [Microterricola gilva]RZU64752.1 uncharacterized protein DUF2809 [Microterricola gilva]
MTASRSSGTGVLPWLAAVCAVVALGLLVRFGVGGVVGDLLGGALYTILIALLVYPLLALGSVARGRLARVWLAAAIGCLFSVAIELLQLTGAPAALSTVFPPARLVFGTSFAALDLVAYACGALVFGVLGTLVATRRGQASVFCQAAE